MTLVGTWVIDDMGTELRYALKQKNPDGTTSTFDLTGATVALVGHGRRGRVITVNGSVELPSTDGVASFIGIPAGMTFAGGERSDRFSFRIRVDKGGLRYYTQALDSLDVVAAP